MVGFEKAVKRTMKYYKRSGKFRRWNHENDTFQRQSVRA